MVNVIAVSNCNKINIFITYSKFKSTFISNKQTITNSIFHFHLNSSIHIYYVPFGYPNSKLNNNSCYRSISNGPIIFRYRPQLRHLQPNPATLIKTIHHQPAPRTLQQPSLQIAHIKTN